MSLKKSLVVKASLIKKADTKRGSLTTVIASVDPNSYNPEKVELAHFGCQKCNTKFSALANTSPFCVTCGNDDVEDIESVDEETLEPEDLTNEEELASVDCKHCLTANIITLETASLLDTRMHCVTCGTELEFESVEDAESDIPEDLYEEEELSNEGEEEVEEIEEDEIDFSIPEESDTDSVDEEVDFGETDEIEDGEEVANVDEVDVGVDLEEEVDTLTINDGNSAGKQITLPETANVETLIQDTGAGAGTLEVPEKETINLYETAQGDLTFERVGDKILSFIGSTPVATLEKANAGNNKDIFYSKSLINGIANYAKSRGVTAALNDFNFTIASIEIPYTEILERKVQARVEEKQKEVASTNDKFAQKFEQCLALAAAGLPKGFFKGISKGSRNVIVSSLSDKLQALGVRNAESLVTATFRQHSDDYHKVLIEVAKELMGKSQATRNELAETIGDADLQLDEVEDEIEQQLETATIKTGLFPNQNKSSVTEIASEARKATGGVLFLKN